MVQRLVNMMDGVEQTSKIQYFFLHDSCIIMKNAHFSYWRVWNVLIEDFHAHVAAVKSISLYWMSDCS